MYQEYLNLFKKLILNRRFFFKKIVNIIKNIFTYNFIKRLFTTFLLLLIFYIIRTSSVFIAQCIFFFVFLCLLWELKKSFNIGIELLIISKLIILVEF